MIEELKWSVYRVVESIYFKFKLQKDRNVHRNVALMSIMSIFEIESPRTSQVFAQCGTVVVQLAL